LFYVADTQNVVKVMPQLVRFNAYSVNYFKIIKSIQMVQWEQIF